MKDIGQQLREAREKRKLSIQDVSIATKINTKVVKAIEDGDEENLPAKPFLRGFVQTYARYLELNVDDVMKRFLEFHGSTKPKPQITEEGQTTQVNHEEVQNKFEMYKKIAYGAAAVVAIVFIFLIQRVVSKYEQESKNAKEQKEAVKSQLGTETAETAPENASTPPAEGATTATTETASTTAPASTTPATTEVKTEAKPVEPTKPAEPVKTVEEKKPEEKKPEPVVAKPVSTTPLVTAPAVPPVKPAEVKPATPPVKTAETKPAEPAKVEEKKPEEKKPDAASAKPQQVIIEALDNVEIRYNKDGEGERTVKLKPEQYLTIKATSKISLNVSDSGAVNIIHNGRDKGVPGNLGTPTKISYP